MEKYFIKEEMEEPAAKKPKRLAKTIRAEPYCVDTSTKKSTVWTYEEKAILVKSLKKHGFGNMDIVTNEVKTRTAAEIREYLTVRCRKIRLDMETKEAAVNIEKAPINVWCDKIKNAIPPKFRGQDFTISGLPEILMAAANEEPNLGFSNAEIDFKSIYSYLSTILGGNIPQVLNDTDSMIVLHLINSLSNTIRKKPFAEERELLKNLQNRKIDPVPPEMGIQSLTQFKYYKNKRQLKLEAKQKSKIAASTSSIIENDNSSSRDSTTSSNNQKSTEETQIYEKYPKFDMQSHSGRYLIWCMNPLQIPIQMLEQEYQTLHKQDKKTND